MLLESFEQATRICFVRIHLCDNCGQKEYNYMNWRVPQVALVIKDLPASAGDRDVGSIPGSRRSPGGGNGNSLQHSHLERSHGQRSLVGYSSWDHKRVRHNWSDLACRDRKAICFFFGVFWTSSLNQVRSFLKRSTTLDLDSLTSPMKMTSFSGL